MTRIVKSKCLTIAGLLALLCALLSPAARADGTGLADLTITFPTISGIGGQQIHVVGNLANTSTNTLFFSNESLNFNSLPTSGAQTDVVLNAIFGLGPGSINGNSTLTGVDLFTFTIPKGTTPGLYNLNFYDLLGGIDPTCSLGLCDVQLGTVDFTVNVHGGVSTPEPSTLMLLVSGLLAGLLVIRRATQ